MYNIFYFLCTYIFLKFSLYLIINLISESEILNSHRKYLNGFDESVLLSGSVHYDLPRLHVSSLLLCVIMYH